MLTALIVFVAAQHIAFMVLEMFLWEQPLGRKVFGLDEDFARRPATLAANQGLYNGFLAAGLLYGLLLGSEGRHIIVLLLVCIVIAGIFGGLTVSRKIFLVQTVPALLTLLAMFL